MSLFTPRQREVLHHRLRVAICWRESTAYAKGEASRMATTVIDAIEDNASSAMAMRRATEALVKKLEDEAKSA